MITLNEAIVDIKTIKEKEDIVEIKNLLEIFYNKLVKENKEEKEKYKLR